MRARRPVVSSAIRLFGVGRSGCALALVLGLWCGCAPATPARPGVRIVDDLGDTVAVAVPARRVVSLIPATTELLFAIGAQDAIVGRTRWCDYPPAAAAVPNLGEGIIPNLEAIVARRPDLVLLYGSGQNTDVLRRLASFGIPAVRLHTDQLADVPRLARLLGRLTGHQASADSLASAFEADLAAATEQSRGPRPTAFLLVWDHPPMTVGRGSFLTELLERAGAENLFADVATSSAPISIEAVASRNPDVILTLGSTTPAFAERPEWQTVPAVRARRFVHADGSEFSRPSPRAPAAIRELRAAFSEAGR